MARFHFSLRSFTRADVNAVVVSQRTLRALHLDETSEVQEIVQGPGWFDSSWELVHGLEVREGVPGDARLGDWLDACARAAPFAASARSVRVDALQFGDLDLAGAVAAAEAAPRDAFERFRIDGLALA
ncbi:MAG: hypothetical protein V4750_19815 [Pseudomonadota bacterium]